MISNGKRILIAISIALSLTGCNFGTPSTVTVPANDPTLPDGLWLQANVPDRPLGNVFLNGGDSAVELGEPGTFTVTASATDSDGGIHEVRIYYDVTLYRGSTITGPGLQSGPIAVTTVPGGPGSVVPRTSNVQATIDSLAELRTAHDIRVRLWAEAENFSGGIVKSPILTVPSRFFRLRLFVVALADDNGGAAANVNAADFAQLVTRVNKSYEGTMIRFVFDPASDFTTMNSTVLNREQAAAQATGTSIAATNQGRIPLFLRFGSGTQPTGNGNGWPPVPPVPPAGHSSTPTHQQDFVWLPNSLDLNANTMLNLWDGGFVAHELGHYLGLYHTFPSWGDAAGDIFGGPPSAADADQKLLDFMARYGGTVYAMDGDQVVDTPPDPSIAFYRAKGVDWCSSPSITVSGTLNGTAVTYTFEPDTRNVMSYFDPCTKDANGLWSPGRFSKDQIKQMHDTLLKNPLRRHLLPP